MGVTTRKTLFYFFAPLLLCISCSDKPSSEIYDCRVTFSEKSDLMKKNNLKNIDIEINMDPDEVPENIGEAMAEVLKNSYVAKIWLGEDVELLGVVFGCHYGAGTDKKDYLCSLEVDGFDAFFRLNSDTGELLYHGEEKQGFKMTQSMSGDCKKR